MDLSQDVVDRLKGTVACDELGRPLVLHHGTPFQFDRFERTNDLGFHFGTIGQAIFRENEGGKGNRKAAWRIESVAIAAKKILVYPDDPRSWHNWGVVDDLCRMTNPSRLEQMRHDGIKTVPEALARIRQFLRDDGYDAIVYRNMWEGSAKHLEWSWCVLDADALVMLGDQGDTTKLLVEIGDSSQQLPTDLKSVPAVQTRSCALKFAHDKRLFLATMQKLCADSGSAPPKARNSTWAKPLNDSYEFEIEIAGLRCKAFADVESGGLTLLPHDLEEGALNWVIDRNIIWVGIEEPKEKKSICFQWLPGTPIGYFIGEMQDRMAAIAQRLQSSKLSNAA